MSVQPHAVLDALSGGSRTGTGHKWLGKMPYKVWYPLFLRQGVADRPPAGALKKKLRRESLTG